MTAVAGDQNGASSVELIGTLDKRDPTRAICKSANPSFTDFAGVRVLYVSRADIMTKSSWDTRRRLPTTLPRPSGVSRSPAAVAARDVLFG